jgi:hypothetical protein
LWGFGAFNTTKGCQTAGGEKKRINLMAQETVFTWMHCRLEHMTLNDIDSEKSQKKLLWEHNTKGSKQRKSPWKI